MIKDSLEKLLSQQPVDIQEHQTIFADMLAGRLSEIEISSYLTALRAKGEDFPEISAGAATMRAKAAVISISGKYRPLADNCGTGGDGSGSFNISTTSAIVAASLGMHIAKHGNRSISSNCGSADLLFRAGFPETISPENTRRLLEETGFTFFFAPNFHPAMKYVGPVRKALGIRTIFNLLGPLANPLAPEIQLIGVGANKYLRPVAEAALHLGIESALIVHSRDGMDEISPNAITDCILVKAGSLTNLVIDPVDFGISGQHDLSGGDANENFKILQKFMSGKAKSCTEAVALNTGALLWLAGKCPTIAAGYQTAKKQIESGKIEPYFATWLTKAHEMAGK